jgi:alkanesulfonate monooxygenase SsuD/methylene tetrahydromethanopterin reductase-like flavin-dependent oxidoreductase (luciferase family)
MKFSTFNAFMLVDAKLGGAVPEGQGSGTTPAQAIQNELELIEHADVLGYDTCWVREHHFTQYGFLPNTLSLLAHAAARTERIRLGTAVVTLPLHHPIRVAEDVALVDVLSGGRMELGIGRGYQSIEFEAFGIPLNEARARTDEAIDAMRLLWSSDHPVNFKGEYFNFENIELQPKPVQRPGPPIHYASISAESIVHYGSKGIPYIIDPTGTTSSLANLAQAWSSAAVEHGHPATGDLVACRYVWVAPTDDSAREYVGQAPQVKSLAVDPSLTPRNSDGSIAKGYEYWEKGWHGRTKDHYASNVDWDDRWIAGNPERVVKQIKELEQMGYTNLCVIFGLDVNPSSVAELKQRMSLFADEIMPAFRSSEVTTSQHQR